MCQPVRKSCGHKSGKRKLLPAPKKPRKIIFIAQSVHFCLHADNLFRPFMRLRAIILLPVAVLIRFLNPCERLRLILDG